MEIKELFESKTKELEFKRLVKSQNKRNKCISYSDIENICLFALWKVLNKYGNIKDIYKYVNIMVKWDCCKFLKKQSCGYIPTIIISENVSKEEDGFCCLDYSQEFSDILSCLKEKDAKLIKDRFLDKKTLSEIAKEENCSKQWVNIRINKVLEKLKKVYNK